MAPFDLSPLSTLGSALVFGGAGFAFGAVLELAGFGDTRKLAAQFYLKDLTVLKTMFTGIVTAAVLLFLASSFGLLDLSRVWVNPTYLWPEILGGLIMGVGFVLGGFCPGTSLVAAGTLKVDGILFVLGGLVGVGLFGETVHSFEPFWLSSFLGKLTLPEWLGLSTGATLLIVIAMALVMFALAEKLEARFAPTAVPVAAGRRRALRRGAAVALVALAAVVAAHGQPSPEQRFQRSQALQALVRDRAVFVHPAEVVALRNDVNVEVNVIDVRAEHDFNLFHVGGARRVDPAALETSAELKRLQDQPATSVTFLVSNGEEAALAAWRRLKAQGVPNLYVVEGGVNRWLELYRPPACVADPASAASDALAWRFAYATGESLPSARPELAVSSAFHVPCEEAVSRTETAGHAAQAWPAYAFTKRVKLQTLKAVKGGCG
jgi:rhodanese-related sulfurtransferase